MLVAPRCAIRRFTSALVLAETRVGVSGNIAPYSIDTEENHIVCQSGPVLVHCPSFTMCSSAGGEHRTCRVRSLPSAGDRHERYDGEEGQQRPLSDRAP